MGSDAEHQYDGALQRHVMALIVAHLRDHNLNQAALAVSNATMTPLQSDVPPHKLLDLVRKIFWRKMKVLLGISCGPG